MSGNIAMRVNDLRVVLADGAPGAGSHKQSHWLIA